MIEWGGKGGSRRDGGRGKERKRDGERERERERERVNRLSPCIHVCMKLVARSKLIHFQLRRSTYVNDHRLD